MDERLERLLAKTWDIIEAKHYRAWNVCDYEGNPMEPSQYIIDKAHEYYMTCVREAATILGISYDELEKWQGYFDEGAMELAAELR